MKDITILLPIHKIEDTDFGMIERSITSFKYNKETYKFGELYLKVICPENVVSTITNIVNKLDVMADIIVNQNETDFCSQINYGVENVTTDYFSILEYDDEYSKTWFNMVHEYYFSHEDVSVFLPINVQYSQEENVWQYCNEIVWASSFSNELGFIDFECLENCSTFNLTGGVFNTKDFKTIGGLKPSIKLAFNYEFLLRLTNKKLKAYVVPKEGYYHLLTRKGSLTEEYLNTLQHDDIQKWFELAKREYTHTEDRKKTISSIEEELK